MDDNDFDLVPVTGEDLPVTEGLDTEKINQIVIDICEKSKYEIMRCVNCPIVTECGYPKKRLKPLRTKAEQIADEVYEEELELDESAEAKVRAEQKRDYTYNFYIKDNAFKYLANDRCVFERKEILSALQKFVDANYDIADPRTYLVVNELISNLLNAGRMNKTFTNLGLLLRKDTPHGPIYYQNPLLKIRLEFSKMIIEATESLDRMLKSDETQMQAKSFTDHLIKQLRLRDDKSKKRKKVVFDDG